MSAAVRLSPRPPTWVVSSITGMEGSLLKRCTIPKRADASTLQGRKANLALAAIICQSFSRKASAVSYVSRCSLT